ncbi:MAG: EFR1 family ferrodoxin [Candidatus Izemoplasmatales bacterium]|nr:EFR1 family ferrodoxin [Candidatus Izemoplasmatales bacterium]MDD5292826.1 EFR1 family ferrodoxin [Candidatus Izemoplasmatales bacterium]
MNKAIIYYFTGTGNTRIASEMIEAHLKRSGFSVTLFEVRRHRDAMPDPNDFDVVGFGYPIHAFNPPRLFLKTIQTLPRVAKHKTAFIFKTAGEPFPLNRASSWGVIRALKKQGYDILMDRHLLMPYNILFRYPESLAKHMVIHTNHMAELIARDVIHQRRTPIIIHPWTWVVMMIMRIQWVAAKVNGPLFIPKKRTCIQCGICQKMCPSDNITFDSGYPKFGFDCSMCMGCVMYCPTDAIRPGLITPLRVNGAYDFPRLMQNGELSDECINETTKGYFRLFRKYYRVTQQEIDRMREELDR